jgi:putative ABC transport system permease protein
VTRPLAWRLVSWRLRRHLPEETRQAVLGDLIEDYRRDRSAHGRFAAERRFLTEAWSVAQAYRRAVTKDERDSARAGGHLAAAARDGIFAARAALRDRTTTATLVLTIGLALAANTALFSIFDGLLFRPLPFRQSDRLVHLELPSPDLFRLGRDAELVRSALASSPLLSRQVRAASTNVFERTSTPAFDWGLSLVKVDPGFFDLLGVPPFIGRTLTAADATSAPFTLVLGYDVWQMRFGGDRSIVGRHVQIPGTHPLDRWFIAGVMPKGFDFPAGANVWLPIYPFWPEPLIASYGELAPGATVDQLRRAVAPILVTPLREHVRPDGATALAVLLAATALLLLVAWSQVAGLLLARHTARLREIGVRLALGATRTALLRQFALEGAMVVLVGLLLAWLAAPPLVALVLRLLPPEMTAGQHLAPDVRTFVFASALAAIGIGVLAVLPIDLVRRTSPVDLFRGGSVAALRLRTSRARTLLFVGQLAMSAALVYLTGLAVRSFVNVTAAPLGFSPDRLVAIRMPGSGGPAGPSRSRDESRASLDTQRQLVRETLAALAELPAVEHVAGSHQFPMQPNALSATQLPSESDPLRRSLVGREGVIFPGYPAVMGLRLVAGQEPSQDALAAQLPPARAVQVALANETFARHLSAFGPPIGQIVAVNRSRRYRIVGVIEDIRADRPDLPAEPTLLQYLPSFAAPGWVLVRVRPDAAGAEASLKATLDRIWGDRAPREIIRIDDAIARATVDYRARTLVLSLIGLLCLPLTVIGVAGAVSFTTRQRTRDIAIELAIGAQPRDIVHRVVRQTLGATAVALAIGLAGGALVGRILSAFLYGVPAIDPPTAVVSGVVVIAAAWCAAIVPARRAGRISPAEVLRQV